MKGAFSRPGMAERWGAGGHGYSDPMRKLRGNVAATLDGALSWLPGNAMKREDSIALLSTFILVAAQRLAAHTDTQRAAAALRRLADIVERGQLDGTAS